MRAQHFYLLISGLTQWVGASSTAASPLARQVQHVPNLSCLQEVENFSQKRELALYFDDWRSMLAARQVVFTEQTDTYSYNIL